MSQDHGGHGDSHGSGAMGKAIGVGFLVLILANGNMPANTQFALVCGVIAYAVFKRGESAGAHGGGH